jgi:cytochrome P450
LLGFTSSDESTERSSFPMEPQVPYNPQQPYAWYTFMRRHQPLWYNEQESSWHVFRYADIQYVLTHPTLFSSEIVLPPGLPRIITLMDDPHHRQLRSLVAQAFTPQRVAALAPRITTTVQQLLLPILPTGQMDLVTDLADPLPFLVMAELLGVPQEDHTRLRALTYAIASAPPLEAASHAYGIQNYFRDLLVQRRAQPQEDLISALLAASLEDRSLTEEEVLGFCQVLLVAGIETVTYLIGNAMRCFQEYPGTWQQLRTAPAQLPNALEEVLRYYAPQSRNIRVLKADTQLRDTPLRAGDYLTIWFASANRDEEKYAHADRFDLNRFPKLALVDHLGFGEGIHFCLGAPLARLEARIALELLLSQIQEVYWTQTEWEMTTGLVYGPKRMPLTFSLA